MVCRIRGPLLGVPIIKVIVRAGFFERAPLVCLEIPRLHILRQVTPSIVYPLPENTEPCKRRPSTGLFLDIFGKSICSADCTFEVEGLDPKKESKACDMTGFSIAWPWALFVCM